MVVKVPDVYRLLHLLKTSVTMLPKGVAMIFMKGVASMYWTSGMGSNLTGHSVSGAIRE